MSGCDSGGSRHILRVAVARQTTGMIPLRLAEFKNLLREMSGVTCASLLMESGQHSGS